MNIVIIVIGAIFINNVIFSRFLGICPFLGVSKQVETAAGMGAAVTFVLAMASAITYVVQYAILDPLNLGYLQTIAFILVIATLVQLVEMIIKKASPSLYQALGVYLPLITTNCAVLGIALLNIQYEYNFIETVFHGIGAALGFTLAIVLFAGVRERLETSAVPKALEGFPIALITAGLMSIAFLGFSGMQLG
ncbi:MAG: H+/Na+-translocating ferredoxin:NAD+ oxidoreductase subunit [Eubacteriaceae bacterium]|jgi:electron transport complex protein RnfA|nr:H+/Na+-translocating ferredoxin:NAD+ oxidoreductase subunit [Eubacteriaceae bacterium]MDK2936313.1 H+/Na+-translocating ferredoxin:NAD+ oxidoreductase subunit [Eubacteriaceae bacterium]MDN5308312.1 H+/Na+-translocating ferredoxin:NAD+ oxidoreductase subunit [Eubacteriaceae bacterium]